MKAYGAKGAGFKLFESLPVPEPKQGEALIRVLRTAVCATDLELVKGYKGEFEGILGHEFVGEISKVIGSPSDLAKFPMGTRVVGEINVCCCECRFCLSGDAVLKRNHCERRKVLGIFNHDQGAFSEYITLPLVNLFIVPDRISNEIAVFMEPFAAAYRFVEQNIIKPGDKVAVIGDGRLGLLVTLVCSIVYTNNHISIIGKHKEKMDIIENEFVQKVLTNANDVIPENSFDVCFVATASSSGLELATKIVKPLGTIGLKTTCSPESAVPLPHVFNNIVVKEITVNGSRCGPFQPALELLLNNLEMIEKTLSQMISSTYPLEKIETAMTKAAEKTSLKVQIDCTH